jgi:hypothetical protein
MIGVLMLSCATLVSDEAFYDWKNYSIKGLEFNELLKDVKNRYSDTIFELVKKCLSFDQMKRPTINEINGYLEIRKSANII